MKASRLQAGLRQRAEKKVMMENPAPDPAWNLFSPQKLINELVVHRTQVELQAEELARSQNEAEETRHDYVMMFENAPAVYFVLDRFGLILECNRAAGELTGVDRARLTGRPFRRLLRESSHVEFIAFCRRLFAEPFRGASEFVLEAKEGDVPVRIEAAADTEGRRCYVSVFRLVPAERSADPLARLLHQLGPGSPDGMRASEELFELTRFLEVLRLDLTALDRGSRQEGETFKRPRVDKMFQTIGHIAAAIGRLSALMHNPPERPPRKTFSD
jgi:PAS domain S-box-containing protein